VDEGSSLVTQSGSTLEQIVTAVKKVTDIVSEIAAASSEQSAGIEQVNKAVMQLDELTQQNAALVEQASASSQAMADQARGLNSSMERYRADAEGGDPAETQQASANSAGTSTSERRGASRPWTGNRAAAAKPERPVAAARVANGADDAVWKEF
jgi:methyl-accepting chemotaxis protein